MIRYIRSKLLRKRTVLVCCGMVNLTVVHADYSPAEGQRRLLIDHESHTLDKEKLSPEDLPDELIEGKLGDFINPDTGELVVLVTVVDLTLPASRGRT